ncbi:MAG: carbohydrate binding domain-containing protein, partial [Candidatus Omnitrophota bacterium]|nr:carbohydrate binding domain-containing protein [Candidatus Omnitrophota bacterium]
EKTHFMNELDKCLTESIVYPFTLGLPYASNEGTPVYDSWLMQDKPLCVSSAAWYFFAKNNFNPFSAFGNMEKSNRIIGSLDYDISYQFVPMVDNFEYTDIKFHTAYPADFMLLNKSEIDLEWTNEMFVDGSRSAKVLFVPDKSAKRASAAIKRPFLYPQDWSGYEKLSVWVYSNGTRSGYTNNIANISVKDREGEIYNSSPIFLNKEGWTKYTFNLWKDFSRDPYDAVTYGDNMFGLSRIIEIAFVIKSKHPVEDCRIFLDRIELEKDKPH